METAAAISKGRRVAGLVISALVSVAMGASAFGKLSGAQALVEGFDKMHLGPYRMHIGALELLVAVAFAIPKTSALGTILVVGYFGGAIVAHLGAGAPSEMVPAVILGLVGLIGGTLRNPGLLGQLKP